MSDIFSRIPNYSIEIGNLRYPNPFFDITNHYIPTNLKELFKWFEYITFTNPIVSGALYNLASYPITEVIIEGGDKDKIKEYLDKINWRSFFIDVGINRYVYGNAFVIFFPPFDREFICPKCKNIFSDKQVSFKFKNDNFTTTCPKCKYTGSVDYRELPNKTDLDSAIFKIWNPKLIGLKVHPISNKKEFYSDLPGEFRKVLTSGDDEFYLRDTPVNIIKAARKNQKIKFNSNYVFHLKSKSLAGYNSDWGISPLMPLLKNLFHIQILRKANEAIALEHIVPLRIIFPQVDANSAQMINLALWKDAFMQAVKNWRIDQNHIFISNVPVGVQYIGGQYKMLEVNNYVDMITQEIAAGLGIPKEFIYGGLTWSGSSVSLRMLENQLSTYLGELRDLLKWMVNKICEYFDLEKPTNVTLSSFKMIDDIQQKQFIAQLALNNKVSTRTLMSALGLDYDKEIEDLKEEIKVQAELSLIQQEAAIEIQAKLEEAQMAQVQQPQEQDNEQQQLQEIKDYPQVKPSPRTQLGT